MRQKTTKIARAIQIFFVKNMKKVPVPSCISHENGACPQLRAVELVDQNDDRAGFRGYKRHRSDIRTIKKTGRKLVAHT